MKSSVHSSAVAALGMVAGTSTVPFRGCVHEDVFPNERLRLEWVQGYSCPHTQNENGWTKEQEQAVRCCHVIRDGEVQMSVGLAQEWYTRRDECAGMIGVVLSTAIVEYGRQPGRVHGWECSCLGFVLHGMAVHQVVQAD